MACFAACLGALIAITPPPAAAAAPPTAIFEEQGCAIQLFEPSGAQWSIEFCYDGTASSTGEIVSDTSGTLRIGPDFSPPPRSAQKFALGYDLCNLVTDFFFGRAQLKGFIDPAGVSGILHVLPNGKVNATCKGTIVPFPPEPE
jgi:hypothetical protein